MTDQTTPMTAPEIIVVDTKRVSCDGGGGALGHPMVYYEMGDEDFVVCEYCGRHYVLRGSEAENQLK